MRPRMTWRESGEKARFEPLAMAAPVISWFSSQGLDLVIFLEVEGHFCPLDCVMAIERIG
ncbi:hypothetical protein DsansV1_C25g0188181 [Dioscorea sansibarensis]